MKVVVLVVLPVVVLVVVLLVVLEVEEVLLEVVAVGEELLERIEIIEKLPNVVIAKDWVVVKEMLTAVVETLVIWRVVVDDKLEVWTHNPEEQKESDPHWTEFVQLKSINLLVKQ